MQVSGANPTRASISFVRTVSATGFILRVRKGISDNLEDLVAVWAEGRLHHLPCSIHGVWGCEGDREMAVDWQSCASACDSPSFLIAAT